MTSQLVSIKKNLLMILIGHFINIIFPIITVPYLSRIILSEGLGKIGFIQSYIDILVVISLFGVPAYGIKFISKNRHNKEALSKAFQELLSINFIISIFIYIFILLSLFNISNFWSEKELYWITSLLVLFNIIGVDWFYQGIENYKFITIKNILNKAIVLIAIFIFVRTKTDYIKYQFILISTLGILNLVSFINVFRYVTFNKQNLLIKKHFKPLIIVFLISIVSVINTSMDKVMLGFIKDVNSVGLYIAGNKMIRVLSALIVSLGAVLFPRFSYYYEMKESKKYNELLLTSFEFILLFGCISSIFLMFFSNSIIITLFGNEFFKSIYVLKIFAPLLLLSPLIHLFGAQVLYARDKDLKYLLSMSIGAAVNVLLNFIFISFFSYIGAAIATVVSNIVILIFLIFFSNIYIKNTLKLSHMKQYIIASILTIGILILFNSQIDLIRFLIMVSTYFLILILFNNRILKIIYTSVFKKFNQ